MAASGTPTIATHLNLETFRLRGGSLNPAERSLMDGAGLRRGWPKGLPKEPGRRNRWCWRSRRRSGRPRRAGIGNAVEIRRSAATFSEDMLLVFADPPRAFHLTIQVSFRAAAAGRTQGIAGVALSGGQRLEMNGLVGRGQIRNGFVIALQNHEHVFEPMLQAAGAQENLFDRAARADRGHRSHQQPFRERCDRPRRYKTIPPLRRFVRSGRNPQSRCCSPYLSAFRGPGSSAKGRRRRKWDR